MTFSRLGDHLEHDLSPAPMFHAHETFRSYYVNGEILPSEFMFFSILFILIQVTSFSHDHSCLKGEAGAICLVLLYFYPVLGLGEFLRFLPWWEHWTRTCVHISDSNQGIFNQEDVSEIL